MNEMPDRIWANREEDGNHWTPAKPAYNYMTEYVRADSSLRDGIAIVAEERRRHFEVEGWTPEHDDEHKQGEMAIAAACYAVEGTDAHVEYPDDDPEGSGWPWGAEWFKPKDDSRNLARAGALIAAEIDRLRRAATPPAPVAKGEPQETEETEDFCEHGNLVDSEDCDECAPAAPVVEDSQDGESLTTSEQWIRNITPSTVVTPGEAARGAALEIVPDCLSRTCFVKDCGYDHCWGCDDSKAERERVATIISRHFLATDVTQAGIESDLESVAENKPEESC